jgi:DNA-binding transcriptional MerR regulator
MNLWRWSMEVQKLGHLAGVSTRTLRYYDEIGILKPTRINSSGYRIYGQTQVDRLQQILFYRELGVSLEGIMEIMAAPSFNSSLALREHREKLLEKLEQLDQLIANVDKTLAHQEGRITITNKEKFEGFKQQMIEDYEHKYGKEVRAKYGQRSNMRRSSNYRCRGAGNSGQSLRDRRPCGGASAESC